MKRFLVPLLALLFHTAAFATPADDTPTIFIAGDSTAADNSHRADSPQQGWGQPFADLVIPPAKVDNRARAGRSTKSFRDEKHWDRLLADLRPGDWVILQFGHNDQKSDQPSLSAPANTDYPENLRRFIREVRARHAHPVLATSVVRRKWDATGSFIDTLGDYPAAARAVAASENVPLLDLHSLTLKMETAAGIEGSLAFHLPERKDDTHFSARGAQRVATLAASEIHRLRLPLAPWIKSPAP